LTFLRLGVALAVVAVAPYGVEKASADPAGINHGMCAKYDFVKSGKNGQLLGSIPGFWGPFNLVGASGHGTLAVHEKLPFDELVACSSAAVITT
jgi:hypothetical protein